MVMKRRGFLKKSTQAGALVSLPITVSGFGFNVQEKVKIGILADVHQDIIHDGYARLRFFMDDMKKRKPDFIIQMGDFALPREKNQPFLDIWNEFEGSGYHVLGNHDMREERLHLEGRKTSFIAPSPKEIGIPNAENMHPTITERNLKLSV